MKKWLRNSLVVGGVIAVLLVLLYLNSFYWSPLGAVRSWVLGPNELGRFVWEALTGPPAAGALAVIAAWIAFTGIKKQVAEAKRDNDIAVAANEQTARKNDVDQWWATLQWAYTEAKTFAEKDATDTRGIVVRLRSLAQPNTSTDLQKTTESQAIIAILRSLAKHEGPQQEGLSDLQTTTVAEVLGMFGDSPYEGVQNKVDEALIDLGRTSGPPHLQETADQAREYEQGLLAAMKDIDPRVGALTDPRSVVSEDQNVRYDGVVRTTSNRLIAIEAKYRSNASLDRRQLAAILAYLPDGGEERQYRRLNLSAINVDQILIIANKPLTPSARGMLERQASRAGYVTWNLGDPLDEIQRELKRLAEQE